MNVVLAILGAVSQGLLWGVMALGVYITFKILNYADLTCDGSFALGGCVSGTLIVVFGWNPFLSLIAAMVAGMIAGAVTGFLHTKLKIPAVLSGILTMIALYSINLRIMGQANTSMNGVETMMTMITKILPASIQANRNINSIVAMVVGAVFGIILIAILYWFFGTEVGSAIRATGNNEAMIRALGANTEFMKTLGLLISNGFVALSGALVAQSQGYADVGMGTGTIVVGLASIVIGEVVFGKRFNFAYKLASVIAGSILYRIIIAVVLQLGLKPSDLKLLTAFIVALALSVPVLRKSPGYDTPYSILREQIIKSIKKLFSIFKFNKEKN